MGCLLCNLEYSIVKEDVISYVNFVINDLTLANSHLLKEKYVERWVSLILKTGNSFIYFHRILINCLYGFLFRNYESLISDGLLEHYSGIVCDMAQLEEYRGFDAEVAFSRKKKSWE